MAKTVNKEDSRPHRLFYRCDEATHRKFKMRALKDGLTIDDMVGAALREKYPDLMPKPKEA